MELKNERCFQEIRVPVPWGVIAGRWYGDQTIRPIVAIHGYGDNCGTFARLAPLLVSHASLLCIDLPGHGHSSNLPIGIVYHFTEFVCALLRLMNAYKWQKILLIGHSLGAGIALHFTALFPERVDMLIGIDYTYRQNTEHDDEIKTIRSYFENTLTYNDRLVGQSKIAEPSLHTFEECEKRFYEGLQHSVALENCKYILERNITKSQMIPNKYYFSSDIRMRINGLHGWNPTDSLLEQFLSGICKKSVPYLIIKGGASKITDWRYIIIDMMKKHNPHFEIHEVTDATHHLHLNNPEAVAALIKEFLQKYRPLEKVKVESQFSLDDKAKL